MSYHFRELTESDFPLMLRWLQTPHVKAWWDDGDDTLEKVAEHYGLDDEDDSGGYILLETTPDGAERPIGYFQYELSEDREIGIDQFIGEPDRVGKGIGPRAIGIFVAMLREQYGPLPIVLDPAPDNKQAIRCYEKAGFVYVDTRPGWEPGSLAYFMRLDA